ncbi:MAG: hypothetical protein R6V45_10955 [Oceanipulchritudo sp.]
MAKSRSTSLWRPSNLLAATGILILKLSARLPLRLTRLFGKFLGTLMALFVPYRRNIGLINLRLCFPEMTERDRRRLLFRHYQSLGMGIFEMAAAWWKPGKDIQKISKVIGLEHMEAVKASGRGALLLTAHMTSLELAGRILLNHHPFSCLYRKPDQPWIARVMTECRSRLMRQAIHFDQMKDLIRALLQGEFVWYAPDQGRRIKYSALIPFFGVPAVTNTATGRLARMGKAAVLPFLGYRLPDGSYCVEILPEMARIPSGDSEADALEVNRLIEDFVRKAPEQYFWLHRRFKRRGEGFEDVYAPATRRK